MTDSLLPEQRKNPRVTSGLAPCTGSDYHLLKCGHILRSIDRGECGRNCKGPTRLGPVHGEFQCLVCPAPPFSTIPTISLRNSEMLTRARFISQRFNYGHFATMHEATVHAEVRICKNILSGTPQQAVGHPIHALVCGHKVDGREHLRCGVNCERDCPMLFDAKAKLQDAILCASCLDDADRRVCALLDENAV
ncbi:hypothetical protein GQ43DRAFT_252333 [Delitschia confertaspora ATCC 74209]|uniref:Uncharacterized protein n=1 Tax=Delitschia confertaspora ATCC 74209 TaxID=1513339 RepID=A0A9P4ML10_9PLEO|nr:hypothetical protein GQ43DRAFT_252333 [Delitschia confertaspora ATCC 74209]